MKPMKNRRPWIIPFVLTLLLSLTTGAGSTEEDALDRYEAERQRLSGEAQSARLAEAKAIAALDNAREVKKAADASNSPSAGKAREIAARAVEKAEQALALARAKREQTEKELASAQNRLYCEEERRLDIKLSALLKDLEDVKTQFKRLDKSVAADHAAFSEWSKIADHAVTSARDDSIDLLTEAALDFMLKKLDPMDKKLKNQIGEADAEILRAEAKNAPAVELLKRERQKLVNERMVIEGVRRAADAVDRIPEAKDPEEANDLNELVYEKLTGALDSETVQKVLGISGKAGGYARFARYVVDYAYNVTAFSCSFNRINQLDQNADQHLAAVKKLSERMKTVVNDIKKTRTDLEAARRRCK